MNSFGVRHEMVCLMLSGIIVVYTLRVNMSVAAPSMREELGWTETEKGVVLSAFYWGYALGQIPASRLAYTYGAKWMFGLSVLIPSLLTILVPLASRHSYEGALIIRALIGFFESASFPAIFHFFQSWIPLEENTVLIPITYSGIYVGEVIGFSLSGLLVDSTIMIGGIDFGGWPSLFYVFAMCGMLWFPFWMYLSFESPASHPRISADEIVLLRKGKVGNSNRALSISLSLSAYEPIPTSVTLPPTDSAGDDRTPFISLDIDTSTSALQPLLDDNKDKDDAFSSAGGVLANRVPWQVFLTHPVALTLLINSFAFGFTNFLLLSEMPSYLKDVLGYNLESSGLLSVIPYLVLFVFTLCFGYTYDYMQRAQGFSKRSIRQIAQFVAFGIGSVLLVTCGFVSDPTAAFILMVLVQGVQGSAQSGVGCAYLDVSPRFSSALNTLGNTVGAIAGILGPIIVSAFTEEYGFVWGFRYTFILSASMCTMCLLLWHRYQTSNIIALLNTPLPIDRGSNHNANLFYCC